MKKSILILLGLILSSILIFGATPFKPSGPIDGNGIYYIHNFTNISCGNFYGNLSYTYIQNAPWLNESDQRYNDTALINAVNTTSNIMGLGFYNSTYLDPFLTSGGFRAYYLSNITDPAGNKQLNTTLPVTTGTTEISVPISTSTISLGTFITQKETNTVVFAAGMRNIKVTARMAGVSQTITLHTIVTRCDGYNETTGTCAALVGFTNSTSSTGLTNTNTEQSMTYYVSDLYSLNTTSRFILNITATKTSGTNTDVILSFGDSTLSRIEVPSPVGVTDITSKVDKSGDTMTGNLVVNANVTANNFKLTTNATLDGNSTCGSFCSPNGLTCFYVCN